MSRPKLPKEEQKIKVSITLSKNINTKLQPLCSHINSNIKKDNLNF